MNNKALIEELSKVSRTLTNVLEQLKKQQTKTDETVEGISEEGFKVPQPRTLITDETVCDIQIGDSVIFAKVNDEDSSIGFREGIPYTVKFNDTLEGGTPSGCPLALKRDQDWNYVDHQRDGTILYKIEG